jgi:hypothetical protein
MVERLLPVECKSNNTPSLIFRDRRTNRIQDKFNNEVVNKI